MQPQFIRIRNRVVNVQAISYIRLYEDLDRIDIRLIGPPVDVSLTITVEGEEAAPVRDRVYGVATLLENPVACRRGKVVTGRHRVGHASYRRP